jgi:hypothetical protein
VVISARQGASAPHTWRAQSSGGRPPPHPPRRAAAATTAADRPIRTRPRGTRTSLWPGRPQIAASTGRVSPPEPRPSGGSQPYGLMMRPRRRRPGCSGRDFGPMWVLRSRRMRFADVKGSAAMTGHRSDSTTVRKIRRPIADSAAECHGEVRHRTGGDRRATVTAIPHPVAGRVTLARDVTSTMLPRIGCRWRGGCVR